MSEPAYQFCQVLAGLVAELILFPGVADDDDQADLAIHMADLLDLVIIQPPQHTGSQALGACLGGDIGSSNTNVNGRGKENGRKEDKRRSSRGS